jgi:hypothetical protein
MRISGIGLGHRLYFVVAGDTSSLPKTVVYLGVVIVMGPFL